MIAFLTSSPSRSYTNNGETKVCGFDNSNDFVDRLSAVWPENSNCLLICAEPENFQENSDMGQQLADSIITSGLSFFQLTVRNKRNVDQFSALMRQSNVVILSGGHTLTRNRFFKRLDLKRHMQSFDGVGISGGSMN